MGLTKGQSVLLSEDFEFGFPLLFDSFDASLDQRWSSSYLSNVQDLAWMSLVWVVA